jgi:hypothetical protein
MFVCAVCHWENIWRHVTWHLTQTSGESNQGWACQAGRGLAHQTSKFPEWLGWAVLCWIGGGNRDPEERCSVKRHERTPHFVVKVREIALMPASQCVWLVCRHHCHCYCHRRLRYDAKLNTNMHKWIRSKESKRDNYNIQGMDMKE